MRNIIFIRGIDDIDKQSALISNERRKIDTEILRAIPNSPMAYWIVKRVVENFKTLARLEDNSLSARVGLQSGDDFKFLRLWWEVDCRTIMADNLSSPIAKWTQHAKGGKYAVYYADLDLVSKWPLSSYSIKTGSYLRSSKLYLKAGYTYPKGTTSDLNVRAMPAGTVFGIMGLAIIPNNKHPNMYDLGIFNSSIFRYYVNLSLGLADKGRRSYEVGILQNIPYPEIDNPINLNLLSQIYYDKRRYLDNFIEDSHAFSLLWLLQLSGETLVDRFTSYQSFVIQTETELAQIQTEIDELVFDLYKLSEEDRALIQAEMSGKAGAAAQATDDAEAENMQEEVEDAEDDEEEVAGADLATLSYALLSWCVGAAFGRWDVRMALDAGLIPELQGPFERLPVVAPAGLVGVDGYPAQDGQMAPVDWLKARSSVISLPEGEWHNTTEYPLNIAWDGILVSDQGGPNDLATRVRLVLRQVFGEQAENMEEEALRAIQGEKKGTLTLDDYLRHPKHFFASHLKGYSRSRRKAPIYWPLTHKDAPGFVVWIYYPRMDAQTLPRMLTDVVLPRLDSAKAEVGRLQAERAASDNAKTARALEQAEDFARGVGGLADELRRVVDAGYTPEHDDGAILSAAPLHAIFPWKDLAGMFRSVQAGKYPWSHQHGIWANEVEGAVQ